MSAVTLPEKILFATTCVYDRMAKYFTTKPCGCGCGCSDKKFWELKRDQLVIKALYCTRLYELYNDEDIDCMIASTNCVICNDPVPVSPPPVDTCLACDYAIDFSPPIDTCDYSYTFPNKAFTITNTVVDGAVFGFSSLITNQAALVAWFAANYPDFTVTGFVATITQTGSLYDAITIFDTGNTLIYPVVTNCQVSLLGFPFYIYGYTLNGTPTTINTIHVTQLSDVTDFFTGLGFSTTDNINYSMTQTCDLWVSIQYGQYAGLPLQKYRNNVNFIQTNCNLIQVP